MYYSPWQHISRSSHPNLWTPPIAAPMEDSQTPPQSTGPKHEDPERPRTLRLPSVDEILSRIGHEQQQQPQYLYVAQPPQLAPAFVVPQFALASRSRFGFDHRQYYQSTGRGASPQMEFRPPLPPHLQHGPLPPTIDERVEAQAAPDSTGDTPQERAAPKRRGRKKKASATCGQCLLTQTPEWRRGPDGSRTLCNACGLYYLKLVKRFGPEDATVVFAYKKAHHQVQDRIVPSTAQKAEYLRAMGRSPAGGTGPGGVS